MRKFRKIRTNAYHNHETGEKRHFSPLAQGIQEWKTKSFQIFLRLSSTNFTWSILEYLDPNVRAFYAAALIIKEPVQNHFVDPNCFFFLIRIHQTGCQLVARKGLTMTPSNLITYLKIMVKLVIFEKFSNKTQVLTKSMNKGIDSL